MTVLPPLGQPKYVVIAEDDQEGNYRYIGPFDDNTAACAWANHNFRGQPSRWLAVPLEQPELPT